MTNKLTATSVAKEIMCAPAVMTDNRAAGLINDYVKYCIDDLIDSVDLKTMMVI